MSFTAVEQPLDLIRLSLGEKIYVKLRGGREVHGRIHGYDHYLNMVLSDVDEITTTTVIDEETEEEVVKETKRHFPMLFIRGDGVIIVAPPMRTGSM